MSTNVVPIRSSVPTEPFLSRRHLADVYDRSPRWVDELIKRGLPHYWVGNARRFKLSECHAWLVKEGIFSQ